MGKLYVSGMSDVSKQLLNESEKAKRAIPKMLNAGADILVDEEKKSIEQYFGKSKRSTGDLKRSIKKGKEKVKGSQLYIEVGASGKNRHNVSNATVGAIQQRGRKNMDARPWYTDAYTKADPKIREAMREEWENAT